MLRVSQPAVSQMIQQLERQLGIALFHRQGGRIAPTPEANILFAEAERAYGSIKAVERLASGLRQSRFGSLRIAGFPAISRSLLPRLVADYCRDKPEVEITLDSTHSRNIADLVARQEVDLAVSVLPSDRQEVEATLIGTLDAICILPCRHPLCEKAVIQVTDLDGEPFISLGRHDQSRLMIDRIFETEGVRRKLQLETSQSDIACDLVAEGCGISIVDRMTASWYRDDRIAIRPFTPNLSFKVWRLQLRSSRQSLLVQHCSAFLRSNVERVLLELSATSSAV